MRPSLSLRHPNRAGVRPLASDASPYQQTVNRKRRPNGLRSPSCITLGLHFAPKPITCAVIRKLDAQPRPRMGGEENGDGVSLKFLGLASLPQECGPMNLSPQSSSQASSPLAPPSSMLGRRSTPVYAGGGLPSTTFSRGAPSEPASRAFKRLLRSSKESEAPLHKSGTTCEGLDVLQSSVGRS